MWHYHFPFFLMCWMHRVCSVELPLLDWRTVVPLKDNEIRLKPHLPIAFSEMQFLSFRQPLQLRHTLRHTIYSRWADKNLTDTQDAMNVAAQIGRLLRKSYLGLDSRGILSGFLCYSSPAYFCQKKTTPKLLRRSRTWSLVPKRSRFYLSHFDINQRNVSTVSAPIRLQILLNDALDVAALIDWEQTNLLPFGMNAWCIRFLYCHR